MPTAGSYSGITNGALRPVGGNRSNRGGGFAGGYGFYGAPFLPYYDGGSISSFPGYDEQAGDLNSQQSYLPSQDPLAQQLDQMSDEIRQLKQNQLAANQLPPYAPYQQYAAPQKASAPETQAVQVPIIFVLQNGSRVSVQSYAIMNGTVWDFSKQPVRKIPVDSINVDESQKATEAGGGEFPALVPAHAAAPAR